MENGKWMGRGVVAGLLLLSGAVAAQSVGTQGDGEFLVQAISVNQTELELGRLAADRASTPDVKAMGQKMVQKHTELGQQLSQLAQQSGVSADAELAPDQKETIARLASLSGSAFDTEFQRTVEAGHVKELAMYEEEAGSATGPQLRALAEQRVKTLRASLAGTQEPARESQDW